ncbi:MAG: hypothetical protein QM791_06445 [Ferruginibacter sp.]
MCEFDSLYLSDLGYVVHCKKCGVYQVAFASTMLSLNQQDFDIFCGLVRRKYEEENMIYSENAKCVVIPTPAKGVQILLTRKEAENLNSMLEEADNEAKALSLMSLFNG